ncbi:hypothetical protein GCM10010983_37550 [Caulobacter rhizosphaerae]|jgi:hypothetical protein|nr:hypothetical protein GCM10010983_37550 [Caulobacter rhizosphaerae]
MMLLAAGPPAEDARADTLKQRLEARVGLRARPVFAPSGRFRTEGGDIFVLDRTGPKALLKFQNRDEVWALEGHPAPRGDTVFKNDVGETVLRASKLGGLTLFTRRTPNGQAVTLVGPGEPLSTRRPLSLVALLRAVVASGHRATRAAQHPLAVTSEDEITAETAAPIADAAAVVAEAFEDLDRSGRRDLLARWRRVVLVLGDRAEVKADGDVLVIGLNPKTGPAGRPSSARIVRALKRRR